VSSEGYGRLRYFKEIHRQLLTNKGFRDYFEQETDVLPSFYAERIRRDLGSMWQALPEGAMYHDPYAYLKSRQELEPHPEVVAKSA
jgi:hypothetical protein